MTWYRTSGAIVALGLWLGVTCPAEPPPPPWTVTDYDENDWYLVRGTEKLSYHGMRESWVYNRAMLWLDKNSGVEGAILCYSSQSPLWLTGNKQVSRWYAGPDNELADVDDHYTRLTKRNPASTWDHACLPPFQFEIEQHPIAEFEVQEATHPWQFVVVVKGRSGPPLFVSPWLARPKRLTVNLLDLYRQKGYDHHFAEMVFFVAVWTDDPKQPASVVFRLSLVGSEAIVPTLPVIRTAKRSEAEGVPIYAVVVDREARRLGSDMVEVTASLGQDQVKLTDGGNGVWKAVVRGVPVGQHQAELRARWKSDPQKSVATRLKIRVTDGQFIGYNPDLRLLTRAGKPLGPITGSYRGQSVFRGIGTPAERLLHGQQQWEAAVADPKQPDYGFHFWESLTPQELDDDYAYLKRCGWRMIHLCSAWLWWPRLDAVGRLSPFYAEQLNAVCEAAGRHGLLLHLAVSHYPLGMRSPPYAQYLEAGYQKSDYGNPQSKFFAMFADYLAQLSEVFRDDTVLSSFTPAGEGDPACGMLFVNMVHDTLVRHDGNHLVLAEPHHQVTQHPNYYRQAGWKPRLGGMRTYHIDRLPAEAIGVEFKLAAMGDIFMGEGCFYGFLGGNHQYMNPEMPIGSYRRRIRETIYTGLALRNPILLTWEERIVEDERVVFEQVRRAVDWSTRFQRPPVAIRVDAKLMPVAGRQPLFRYEDALSRIPIEAFYVWEDEPVPPEAAATLDARRTFVEPAFRSEGGTLPDELKSRLPLALPAGWAANYSWSEDRRILLAFLRRVPRPEETWNTAEGGDFTYVDTTVRIQQDGPIDTWETQCLKPGTIQLRIYRQQGDELVLVGQSERVEMPRPGRYRFTLRTPIEVKAGDMIGFYIPSVDTEIAARHGGRMLFVEGPAPGRLPLARWKTEAKSADIAVFRAADVAPPQPQSAPRARSGLVLENFPSERLVFHLFDLAAKKAVQEGTFQEKRHLEIPANADHFFLLVRPEAAPSQGTLRSSGEGL